MMRIIKKKMEISEMVVVLIGARYQRLTEWINNGKDENIKSISIIKQVGPKIFFYVDTDLDLKTVTRLFKKWINEQGGVAYVYELYGIYKEKIDYQSYLSNDTKDKMKYYNTKNKDLTNQELNDYLRGK